MNDRHPITGCRAESLLGLWYIEPTQHDALVEQAVAIDLEQLARMNADAEKREAEMRVPASKEQGPPPLPYLLSDDGVAVVRITGATTKYPTSYQRLMGGTSTLMTARALRHAADNADVRSILMHIESPGGTVDGAYDLVDEIRRAGGRKHVAAHYDDWGTSAALLFGSQAHVSTANRNANIGSIGTRSMIVDVSKRYERDGIRVIPIAAGRMKAAGLRGTPVTDEQVAYFQDRIEQANNLFVNDVARSRRLMPQFLRDLEARVFIADEARRLNLIDGVCGFEQALDAARKRVAA